MASIIDVIFILVIIFLFLAILGPFLKVNNPIITLPEQAIQTIAQDAVVLLTGSANTSIENQTVGQGITVPKIQESQLANYTLQLINKDRAAYNLPPVTLASEPSGQQHAESMLISGYFSHWDLYGMKPYMRYTLLGGNGSVAENIAYESTKVCDFGICSGNINPDQSLQNMEYSMMYNDSACCNNGHRDNILDPSHNEVSIGVAYNSSTIYLVEDFVDSYITWSGNTPAYANGGSVYLNGEISPGYNLSQIYIAYDYPLQAFAPTGVPSGTYGYGQEIAGVVGNPLYYYPNFTTIYASRYSVVSGKMDVAFSMEKLVKNFGAGEYTVILILNNSASRSSFAGATYTIFINSTGQQYIPGAV
jgi:uncharacterized protein YkwD